MNTQQKRIITTTSQYGHWATIIISRGTRSGGKDFLVAQGSLLPALSGSSAEGPWRVGFPGRTGGPRFLRSLSRALGISHWLITNCCSFLICRLSFCSLIKMRTLCDRFLTFISQTHRMRIYCPTDRHRKDRILWLLAVREMSRIPFTLTEPFVVFFFAFCIVPPPSTFLPCFGSRYSLTNLLSELIFAIKKNVDQTITCGKSLKTLYIFWKTLENKIVVPIFYVALY